MLIILLTLPTDNALQNKDNLLECENLKIDALLQGPVLLCSHLFTQLNLVRCKQDMLSSAWCSARVSAVPTTSSSSGESPPSSEHGGASDSPSAEGHQSVSIQAKFCIPGDKLRPNAVRQACPLSKTIWQIMSSCSEDNNGSSLPFGPFLTVLLHFLLKFFSRKKAVSSFQTGFKEAKGD